MNRKPGHEYPHQGYPIRTLGIRQFVSLLLDSLEEDTHHIGANPLYWALDLPMYHFEEVIAPVIEYGNAADDLRHFRKHGLTLDELLVGQDEDDQENANCEWVSSWHAIAWLCFKEVLDYDTIYILEGQYEYTPEESERQERIREKNRPLKVARREDHK